MASVYEEVRKHGSYTTKTQDEYQEALDLLESGVIHLDSGGSTTVDGQHFQVAICKLIKKRSSKKSKSKN